MEWDLLAKVNSFISLSLFLSCFCGWTYRSAKISSLSFGHPYLDCLSFFTPWYFERKPNFTFSWQNSPASFMSFFFSNAYETNRNTCSCWKPESSFLLLLPPTKWIKIRLTGFPFHTTLKYLTSLHKPVNGLSLVGLTCSPDTCFSLVDVNHSVQDMPSIKHF